MLYWKKARCSKQIQYFCDRYAALGGYPLDFNFAADKDLRLLILGGKIIGGVLLNAKGDFRSLNDLTPDDLQSVQELIDPDSCFEAMCFWLERPYRSGIISILSWFALVLLVFCYPKKSLILSTVSDSLATYYRRALPEIYQGRIETSQQSLPKYIFYGKGFRTRLFLATLYSASLEFSKRCRFSFKKFLQRQGLWRFEDKAT